MQQFKLTCITARSRPNSEFAIRDVDEVLPGAPLERRVLLLQAYRLDSQRIQTSKSMSQTATRSHQWAGSFRSWSTLLTPKPKPRSATPQVLPITSRASGNGEETSAISSSRSNSSDFVGTPDARYGGPPSYAQAVSRSEPASYRFVQESPFSMSLVAREGPSNTAYNISVGVNVWMPSEHITLVRRHANPEGPVLARLEQV